MYIVASNPLIQYGATRNLLNREFAWNTYGIGAGKYGVDLLEINGDEMILDIGSGTGADVALIASRLNKGGKIFALDISEPLIKLTYQRVCNSITCFSCINGTAVNLPYSSGNFDVVLAKLVLNHVADVEAALNEIVRVVKRTGVVLVTTGVKTRDDDLLRIKHRQALQELGIRKNVRFSQSPFNDENAMHYPNRFFSKVSCHYYSFQMVFNDAESFMFYYSTLPCFQEASKESKIKIRLATKMRKLISKEAMPIVLDRSRNTFFCKNP
jgi:ubiquinone/menaquinone biosynthesis C-methylase UbiE